MPFASAVIQLSQTDEHELQTLKMNVEHDTLQRGLLCLYSSQKVFHSARGKTCVDHMSFMYFYCPPAFLTPVASLLLRYVVPCCWAEVLVCTITFCHGSKESACVKIPMRLMYSQWCNCTLKPACKYPASRNRTRDHLIALEVDSLMLYQPSYS